MTYRPAITERAAALLGLPAQDTPSVTCDNCGAVKYAVTARGDIPAWLRKRTAPPGWLMERREREDGLLDRRDLCPRCKP